MDKALVRQALEDSILSIDDWLNTYASEMCDQARVKEARERIREAGGTLAYIADIQEANRRALAELDAEKES